MDNLKIKCHSCKNELLEFSNFKNFFQITSDCQPSEKNGVLSICVKCGLLQKTATDKWLSLIKKIYSNISTFL